MNPICITNFRSKACQRWIYAVGERCQEVLANERPDYWAAWWHDDTPGVYKPDFEEMTAYDCNKLKRELNKVLAVMRKRDDVTETETPESTENTNEFEDNIWWVIPTIQMVFTIIGVFAAIILNKRKSLRKKINNTIDVVEKKSSSDSDSAKGCCKKIKVPKAVGRSCRRLFLHSNKALKARAEKRKEVEMRRKAKIQQEKERMWSPKVKKKHHHHHRRKKKPPGNTYH